MIEEKREIKASGAVAADTADNEFDFGAYQELVIYVNVTAVSGTSPTLNIYIEGSSNSEDFGRLKDSAGVDLGLPQITVIGLYTYRLINFGKWIRLYYDVGGTTPSFTFSVEVHAKAP